MKRKVGLITIYHVPNYGSVLQTYATQILLEKMGLECWVINYKYPNEWHFSQGHRRPALKSRIGCMFGIKPAHRKANKLVKFKKNHFNFTKPYNSLDKLRSADWSSYDMFVVGSDQVWKSYFTLGDSAFMLSFIPDNKYRISIASSFATRNIPDKFVEKYKKYLSLFNAISVREDNGVDIIKKQLNLACEPKVLLDPTLLLNRNEWISIVSKSSFKKRKKYILLYMLTYAFDPRPKIFDVIRHLQGFDDYDVIALEGYSECANCGIDIIDKTDSSISDFIHLFANADIVVTSSFHGTAFAVNFGIPLISIVPDCTDDDRQYSLLSSLNLQSCIVSSMTSIDNIQHLYDVTVVTSKLEHLRADSLLWIENKLNTK